MGRASWDDYFLQIAEVVATRATCTRRQVGAVIVHGRRPVGTGYNGAPAGLPHCTDGACPRAHQQPTMGQGYGSCIAIHAEANALLHTAPADRDGATLYCTDAPCFDCAKLIANSGVAEVVVARGIYDTWPATREFLLDASVRVRLLPVAAAAA